MLRKNGHFVLRVTELQGTVNKATRDLCLSVFWNNGVHHFLLRPNLSKTYQICAPAAGEKLPEFENVSSMVQFYMKSETPFGQHKIVLKKPIRRQVSFDTVMRTCMSCQFKEWQLRHEEITCKLKL